MRAARALAVCLTFGAPGLGCTAFDIASGSADAGDAKGGSSRDATKDVETSVAPDAAHGEASTCTKTWVDMTPDASCSARQLYGVATGTGIVTLLHLARAADGGIALLYGQTTDGGMTLTLSIVDPITHAVTDTHSIASAASFDSAALSYDDQGTLSVAYHAGPGDDVVYQAFTGALDAGSSEVVVADASASLLALSTLPSSAGDGGQTGPLGNVPGTVGLAFFQAPPEPNDFSEAYVQLFARQNGAWNDLEQYGFTEVRSDFALQPNYQGGVVASGVAYSTDPMVPYEACTWQMAGRASQCGPSSNLFGLSLAVGANAAYLAYTYPDPTSGETLLDVATDTDGTYTFPLLSTVAMLPAAVSEGQAEPRIGVTGGTLAIGVSYPTADLSYRVDFYTWDVATHAVTNEQVTTVHTNGAATPPLDLVVDRGGVPTLAIADPSTGTIYFARAILPNSATGQP